jgi:hypothetical protein
MNSIQPGLYKHYSGKLYQVYGISRNTETLEEYVMYQQLYGNFGFWHRPFDMFTQEVEIDNKKVPRFTFIKTIGSQAPELKCPLQIRYNADITI